MKIAIVVLVILGIVTGPVFASPCNGTSVAYRARRSPPSRCCNDGFEDSLNHEKVLAVRSECVVELGLTEMPEEELVKNGETVACLIECVTKKHELADEHGDLLHEDLAKAVKDHFSVAEWKAPLLDGIIAECFKFAEEQHEEHPSEDGKCNPEGFYFSYCLWKSFTLACPEEMQDDSERCESIRGKLKSNEKVEHWNADIDEAK
ncbi:uncharacterized protein LOC131691462 [Topomyia yanbarensis]|uniref:uncharacterized protein LOC131691462 n=1 Tax=Topomyia yanbarensis TaxID=2498891 RepID=UPI00273CB903|nr:uncharacterized protein LOC131691462 [Topomyia yanbarensis]